MRSGLELRCGAGQTCQKLVNKPLPGRGAELLGSPLVSARGGGLADGFMGLAGDTPPPQASKGLPRASPEAAMEAGGLQGGQGALTGTSHARRWGRRGAPQG